ncbi:MAG: hypothetical protein AM324_015340 [Candidatus Thorarchaeota archaeon SMTZ1-83]|nr:MAG: hypothetical protein AM324_16460 [Candidatus Thorarchaeota archaeon SMTZ1-83]
MDVRLRRASRLLALTAAIVLITALSSYWLTGPPVFYSWKREGSILFSETGTKVRLPWVSNFTFEAERDPSTNDTRIMAIIDGDTKQVILISEDSAVAWNRTGYLASSPWGFSFRYNETHPVNSTAPTTYILRMIWNATLTFMPESSTSNELEVGLTLSIRFTQIAKKLDPAVFGYAIAAEASLGIVSAAVLYSKDKLVVIE